ncbi:lytic polysaccharide monooxygenase, partial [Amanita thiersii Skay4041]
FATYAAAEGYLASVTIDGKPYFYKSDDVIREVASFDPVQVKNINTVNIACGPGAKTAGTMAKASPGSEIKWPYSIGPMLTYLASCGSQSCEKLDVSKAKWFKISELGLRPNGTWIQEDAARGFPITIRLPPTLRAGNYMARVEMINLANAYTKDQGAQFFPYCVQLGVGGSQSGVPEKGELVTFPGAYKADDAGIYVPNLFGSQSAKNYTFPGGCLAKIAGGTCSSED